MGRRQNPYGKNQAWKRIALLAVCLFSWNVWAHEGEEESFATSLEPDSGSETQEKRLPNSPTIGPEIPAETSAATPPPSSPVPVPVVSTPFVSPDTKSAPRPPDMKFASRATLLGEGPSLFKSLGLASEMFRTRLGYGQAVKAAKPVAVEASATPALSEDFFQKVERAVSSVLPSVSPAGPEWKEEANPKALTQTETTKPLALASEEAFEKIAMGTANPSEEPNRKEELLRPKKSKALRRLLSTVKNATENFQKSGKLQ